MKQKIHLRKFDYRTREGRLHKALNQVRQLSVDLADFFDRFDAALERIEGELCPKKRQSRKSSSGPHGRSA